MMIQKGNCVRLLGILILLLAASSFAQSTISISSLKGAAGATLTANVSGPGDGIAAINFTILYDPATLTFPGTNNDADAEKKVVNGAIAPADRFDVSYNKVADGELRVVVATAKDKAVSNFESGEGVIAQITFTVPSAATTCTPSDLKFDTNVVDKLAKFGVSNAAGESITANYVVANGTMKVLYKGDFNADGKVDLKDFNRLVLGWGTTYKLADFNRLVLNWLQSCP